MNCLHCTAETTNGLALCEACRAAASVYLEFLPVYFRNLARWRPGRAGARPVPGSREPAGATRPINDRVSNALDEAGNALTTWARKLNDDRGVMPPESDGEVAQIETLCRWLNEHLTSIATLDWAGEFMCSRFHDKGSECDGIGHHEHRLQALTLDVIPGWYAGACHLCGVGTYVVPGLSWVTCGGCGSTTYARDHLETILMEARPWLARPKAIAETLVALLDTEMSVPRLYDRIRKWESLGKLDGARKIDDDGDPVGPKRYRLGDCLDLALGESDAPTAAMRDACA